MRLDINLASRPYEDARQFWTRWGTALAAATILTLALIAITISGWRAARADHAQISELKAEIGQRDQIRQQAEDFLNRPENRTTRDESQFLNELIERKGFSWTHVLEDLEKVMPPRIHLVSIHPELDEDNQLSLKMEVAGDKVYAMHQAGKHQEINDYCMFDTLDTYFIFLRTRVLLVEMTMEEEEQLARRARAWLADKMAAVLETKAEACTACDNSCLMHIQGGLHRQKTGVRTVHLAEILAGDERVAQ